MNTIKRINPPSILDYNNDSKMKFGIHKGKKLLHVPADYLLFLYEKGKLYYRLKKYIEHNLDVLRYEVGAEEALKDDFDSSYFDNNK